MSLPANPDISPVKVSIGVAPFTELQRLLCPQGKPRVLWSSRVSRWLGKGGLFYRPQRAHRPCEPRGTARPFFCALR